MLPVQVLGELVMFLAINRLGTEVSKISLTDCEGSLSSLGLAADLVPILHNRTTLVPNALKLLLSPTCLVIYVIV
jgi:hypothetical protein